MSRTGACCAAAVMGMSVMMSGQGTSGPERDRAKVADAYKWNLADVYPSEAVWRTQKEKTTAEIAKLGEFRGALGSSAKVLADALEYASQLDKELSRLYVYASMLSDQDTRLSGPQGMQQEMQQLFAKFGAEAAFVEPEILKVGKATVDKAIAAEPRLKTYAFYLNDIFRRAAHTLSDAEEKLLADAGPLAGSPSNIYTILTNADFPYPTITLKDGKTVKVDQAGYSDLRTSPVREVRQASMSAFFGALGSFSRTMGMTMHSSVQRSLFYSRARKYSSNLEAALNGPNVPVSVYTRLVDGVNRHLPTFHRY